MNKEQMVAVANEYKANMLAINPNFPVTLESMALAVWTSLNPMQRYEVMSSVEKMPKAMAAKQKACVKKIMEIIK